MARSAIDALGYTNKCGYDIEISSVTASDGSHWEVFGVQESSLDETTSDFPTVWTLLNAGGGNVFLRRALADLRESIRATQDTGFFCFRAMESIRLSFAEVGDNDNRNLSWARMRMALNIDKSYLDKLTESGIANRHGESPYFSGEVRTLLMQRARTVVGRYIEMLKMGVDGLSEKDFSLLTEAE